MKKLVNSGWGKFVIVMLCFCIGGILCTVISLFAPAKVEEPSLAEKMYKSYNTTIEKKLNDGTIVKRIVNGDPFFHGHYPFSEPMDISALNYDTNDWLYRITYHYSANDEIVFCFADLWYTFDGGVYTMGNIPYITAAIGGVFDRINGTEYPTEDVTEATTEAQTNTPTTAPTEESTESPNKISFNGWNSFDPDMEFVRNEDGLIVLDGAYQNYWSNGFLIGKSGVDFLSFHSGEPIWVTGKEEHVVVTHNGKDYSVKFAWCSHMGEVGVTFTGRTIQSHSSNGVCVLPIPGNDSFVIINISTSQSKCWYLFDLETLKLSEPYTQHDFEYNMYGSFAVSPDAENVIVHVEDYVAIWSLMDGKVTSVSELTGVVGASQAYWASATQLAVVSIRNEGPQLCYADAVLYDLSESSVKKLYRDRVYGWFRDAGGLEHCGRFYYDYDPEIKATVFMDTITGTRGTVAYTYPIKMQMGGYGLAYYDNEICYLLKPDGTATPLFTTKSE